MSSRRELSDSDLQDEDESIDDDDDEEEEDDEEDEKIERNREAWRATDESTSTQESSSSATSSPVVVCTRQDFAAGLRSGEAREEEIVDVKAAEEERPQDRLLTCREASSILLVPFSFWEEEDKAAPPTLARLLLARQITVGDEKIPLWERTGLPREASELALHFRTLLGYGSDGTAPVQRLRMTERARLHLFAGARVWADTLSGNFAGRLCLWRDIHLVIIPHGAILSISLSWYGSVYDELHRGGSSSSNNATAVSAASAAAPHNNSSSYGSARARSMSKHRRPTLRSSAPFISQERRPFALSLRTFRRWLNVARLLSVKPGVTRGWSFAQHVAVKGTARGLRDELGLKLFAALYGGSCVSLATVANWLVQLPYEEAASLSTQRVQRFGSCQHHSCALLDRAWEPAVSAKTAGDDDEAEDPLGQLSGTNLLWLKLPCVVQMSADGVLALDWSKAPRLFFHDQFMGIYAVLTLHCVSERITLEKLEFLAALQSQHLPSPETISQMPLAEKAGTRLELANLAMRLARYRSSMASDDCGGRPEFREFFMELRKSYDIAVLKRELRDDLRDTLSMVESDVQEENIRNKDLELFFKRKLVQIDAKRDEILSDRKNWIDYFVFTITAVCTPFLLVGGVFGMNNDDLPKYVEWGYLVLGIAVSSILLMLFVWVNLARMQPRIKALQAEKRFVNGLVARGRRGGHQKSDLFQGDIDPHPNIGLVRLATN